MELTFLGTASAYPTPTRGVSSIVYRNDGVYWMFDCGEGTQIQLMKSAIRPGKISKIFITHLHGDHLFGLPGLLCTISQSSSPDNRVPLVLYGPVGLRKFVRVALELSRSQLGFDYIVHELIPCAEQYPEELQGWQVDHTSEGPLHPNEKLGLQLQSDTHSTWHVYEDDTHIVKAGWLEHKIPSFGFTIQEKPLPGRLNVSILKDKGVPPGPLYAKVKAGETISSPTGETISPADVLSPPRPGRLVAILGDSSNSSQMATLCRGADVLVHEATLSDALRENAIEKGHSTPGMAGQFAADVDAKSLVLTHFSQRYRSEITEEQEKSEEACTVAVLVEEAQKVFSGKVTAADDLMTIAAPPRR